MYNADKKELKFNGDGIFKVLMISDFHAGRNYSPKLKAGIEALVVHTNPDFVMIAGDQCLGFDKVYLKTSLEDILEPIEKRGIPWSHVFGNHDRETGMETAAQEEVFESFPLCLSSKGPDDIFGIGNYVLPIYASNSDKIAYNIWALDSNREISDYIQQFGLANDARIILPDCFGLGKVQASPLFDQVMWYYNTSKQMEKENGRKIPAIMCMHVPIIEFNLIYRNPEECEMEGNKREGVYSGELNSGLFMACLQRGDVKGIFCGHEHLNDFQGTYCGITLAYDSCVGYNMSAHDDLRGGRIIELHENGSFNTRHIKLMDIMGEDAVRNPLHFEGGIKYFIRNIN
jgi:DNA repair exonuclease